MTHEAPRRRAMFPLGSVLVPGMPMALHVFEPRYRFMVRDLLGAEGDGEFGVVLIERGREVGGGDARFDVGTLARIAQCEELPDGRFALTVVGTSRLRVVEWLVDDPYPHAMTVTLDEGTPGAGEGALRDRLQTAVDQLAVLWQRLDHRVPPLDVRLDADPLRASFMAMAMLGFGPLDQQRLLEAAGTTERLGMLVTLVDDAAALAQAHLDEPDQQ